MRFVKNPTNDTSVYSKEHKRKVCVEYVNVPKH